MGIRKKSKAKISPPPSEQKAIVKVGRKKVVKYRENEERRQSLSFLKTMNLSNSTMSRRLNMFKKNLS